MLSILGGLVVAGAGVGVFWYVRPRGGKPHPLATAPVLESLIPIGIVGALAAGVALVVSGVALF